MNRGILHAAAAAVTMVVIAGCGGASDSSTTAAAQQDSDAASSTTADTGAPEPSDTPEPSDAGALTASIDSTVDVDGHDAQAAATPAPSLTVRARASTAGGVGPKMQVLVDGVAVGNIEVKSSAYADYRFALKALPSQRVDVAFANDGASGSEDRNLYVDSARFSTRTLRPADSGALLDIGTGAAAFDGNHVLRGQSAIPLERGAAPAGERGCGRGRQRAAGRGGHEHRLGHGAARGRDRHPHHRRTLRRQLQQLRRDRLGHRRRQDQARGGVRAGRVCAPTAP